MGSTDLWDGVRVHRGMWGDCGYEVFIRSTYPGSHADRQISVCHLVEGVGLVCSLEGRGRMEGGREGEREGGWEAEGSEREKVTEEGRGRGGEGDIYTCTSNFNTIYMYIYTAHQYTPGITTVYTCTSSVNILYMRIIEDDTLRYLAIINHNNRKRQNPRCHVELKKDLTQEAEKTEKTHSQTLLSHAETLE